jgi:hypothetical protein
MLFACCSAVVVFPQAFGPSINTAPVASNFSAKSLSTTLLRYFNCSAIYHYFHAAKVQLFPEPHKLFNNNLVIWPNFVWLFGHNSFGYLAKNRSGVWLNEKKGTLPSQDPLPSYPQDDDQYHYYT